MNHLLVNSANCLVMLAMVLTNGVLLADGFEPVGARAVFRELGVSLGPGYHNPPCVRHLRQHYEMAVNGRRLPAHQLTPLYQYNNGFLKKNCMTASRYVPTEVLGPWPMQSQSHAHLPQQGNAFSLPSSSGQMMPMPADTSQISDEQLGDQLQLNQKDADDWANKPNQIGPSDSSDGEHGDQNDNSGSIRPIDSPFEPYSPKSHAMDQREVDSESDRSRDAIETDERSQPANPSTLPQPSSPTELHDDLVWYEGHKFDDVEIVDELTPVDHPMQDHPLWAKPSSE